MKRPGTTCASAHRAGRRSDLRLEVLGKALADARHQLVADLPVGLQAFLAAARDIEDGGSLTILSTAQVDNGSATDQVIFEEFAGAANMELRLDRALAERRIYPAIDVESSSTRHEELLFDETRLPQVRALRRALAELGEEKGRGAGLELLLSGLAGTSTDEFLREVASSASPS